MKILRMELKDRGVNRRTGEIALIPESLDDLWHLKHIIEPGDLVFSLTYRRLEEATDKVRPDKTDKKPLRLGIRLESVEFHKFSHRLRLKGVIVHGLDTELGSYHTFNIESKTELSIIKTWKEHQLKRLREAAKAVVASPIIILTIEEGEAVAGVVRQYGVDELFYIRSGSGKGMDGAGALKNEFFHQVIEPLKSSFSAIAADAMIIAGPGFVKNEFFSVLKEKEPELTKRTRIEQTSSIGVAGFIEVLKRGAVNRLRDEERLTWEVRLMDQLMEEISKDGKAVYGKEEVIKALQFGAIATLLVCDDKLMVSSTEEEGAGREEIEAILEDVERVRGKIVVFSTEFEPGKRLKGLGGLAAILRFKI
ncbi:MAG: mRNA surveillance protein pelota [Halobacteriota archaeon]